MPRRRLAPSAVLATLLLVAGLSGCGSSAEVSGSGEQGFVSANGLITTLPVAERRAPAGEGAGETLEGEQVSLDDYAGKIVVVNVWGSWCAPCRAEAPELVAAEKALADRDVVFLGIDSRDPSREAAIAFQRTFGVTYPSIYDPGGDLLLAFRDTIPANAIPSTLIIDREGRVAAGKLDEITEATLVGLVDEVDEGSDS